MQIVTQNTESHLSEMLAQVERNPDAWIFVRINIAPIHGQILDREGLSRLSLTKIRKMSLQLAEKLNVHGLAQFAGSIMVFEDSDVMALFIKKPEMIEGVLKNLRHEFLKSGMIDLLSIEEMKDKLPSLISLVEEKEENAQAYIIKKRAVEIGEALLEWSQPDPGITREIYKKRRMRRINCVLIIEDDILTRALVNTLLKDEYQVVQAKDAESGIVAYVDHAPDVVFLDIHLPGLNGHDLLNRLMQLDPKAYVVMLSADSVAENVLSTHNKGAAGFIGKPFSKRKILEYIKQCPSLKAQ